MKTQNQQSVRLNRKCQHGVRTLAVAGLVLASAIAFPTKLAAQAYSYSSSPVVLYQNWMSKVNPQTPLSRMSLLGTHESAATSGEYFNAGQCQLMSISDQLNAGIRVLDIRLDTASYPGPQGAGFELWHGSLIDENVTFDTVLDDVVSFLRSHPTETVLMRVDNTNNDPKAGFISTFEASYWLNSKYQNYFWNPANSLNASNPMFQELQGKIVILDNFSKSATSGYGLYYPSFPAQDDYGVNNQTDLYQKWGEVASQLGLVAATNVANPSNQTIFLNYLSGATPNGTAVENNLTYVFPWFVASGQTLPGNGNPELSVFGSPFLAPSLFPDFPHSCSGLGKLNSCIIYYEGTNGLANNWLANDYAPFTKNGVPAPIGIIMADFPGPALIEAVILKNIEQSTKTITITKGQLPTAWGSLQQCVAKPMQSYSLANNGWYNLIWQNDGNLVMYNYQNSPVWASGTSASNTANLCFQNDGNLVIYDQSNNAKWATGTNPYGTTMVFQNDCNLVIYDVSGDPLWQSYTNSCK